MTLANAPSSASSKPLNDCIAACKSRLANLTDLSLPTDYPRPVPLRTVEAETKRTIADKTARAIMRLTLSFPSNDDANGASSVPSSPVDAGSESVSPFDILLAAFVVLLHKYTGEEDITVGSSSLSTNPLVLRFPVRDSDSFISVVNAVLQSEREAALDEVPFQALLEALFPPKAPAACNGEEEEETVNPSLFKVRFFNMTDTSPSTFEATTTSSACDLTVLITQSSTLRRLLPIDINILYNSVLFSESRISDMLDQLETVLEAVSKNPEVGIGSISILTELSKQRLPDPSADLAWDGYEGAITDIFARNARAHPDRVCVVEQRAIEGGFAGAVGDPASLRTFSYDQMHRASNLLAHHLIKSGIQREDVVVLYSYRGVDLVVAVMGVLKAGATFSVIDPAYPPNRQVIYLSVAQPRGLVVLNKAGVLHDEVTAYIKENLSIQCFVPALEIHDDGNLTGSSADGRDVLDHVRALESQDVNVVIGPDSIGTLSFTSGSTGIPKGVRGRHFSLTHFYPWMKGEFGLNSEERFTMLSGIAHDPIQRDIFTPLFLGAQLRIPTAEDIGTPGRLAEWMSKNGITVTHLTPAMGQLLSANATHPIPSLRNAFFVGDVLTKRDVTRLQFLAPNVFIVNMYGTTETQRAVSYLKIPPPSVNVGFLSEQKDIMPAGKGMKDVQLLVVNKSGLLCGVGEVGEIYVRSSGLAEGYLRLDDVTAQKFIQNPFAVAGSNEKPSSLPFYKGLRDRMYRTGDLGRYRPDGSVECTGRADDQVKIRGFRIELGEIDTHLSQHPGVRENVTLVRRDKFEEPTLCSYFVPLDPAAHADIFALIRDIRDYLKQKLPTYAIPTVFVPLTRMPLTPNGKVDKNALPFPDTAAAANQQKAASSPSTLSPVQSAIRSVWSTLLNQPEDNINISDNFFDLGGHSILATRLVFGIRKALAVEIPLGLIYKEPTIAGMALEVERIRGSDLNMGTVAAANAAAQATSESAEKDEFDYAADLPVVDDPQTVGANLPGIQDAAHLTFKGVQTPKSFFLTGATGFLGAFILGSLLERYPSARVYCLVRASNAASGLSRLRENGERHLVWEQKAWVETADPRVVAVPGDLGKDRFGLLEAEWNRLAEQIDVIVHNGALVHWVYPYHKLRAPNVLGTLWGLRLSSQHHLKPFHFVSSTSDLDTNHYTLRFLDRGIAVPESDDLEGSRKGLRSGYGQTKWVAEKLVLAAKKRGVPATIVRPGYIVGDSKTGVGNTDDFLWRLVKGCIQLGKVPRIANVVNMCPVDYVANSVAAIAGSPEALEGHGIFHMWHPHRFRFDDMFDNLATHGYRVEPTEYIHWRTALMDLTLSASPKKADNGSEEDAHALFPLLHFVLDDLPTSTRSPELDDSNALRILKPLGIVCPDVQSLMSVYLGYLVAVGFLETPSNGVPPSVSGAPVEGGENKGLPRLAVWDSLIGKGAVKRTGA
ncbi:large subunit of alpha-aminoadipate reductase [Phlyctochytrium planicorne]|nr:large subunit of alpha-aminoadipate reductase [Phlyctochytrium planicorne]